MNISFVVIAYNEERSIEATLRSILGQNNLADAEIIVVNDGSRDATLPIVQRLAAEYPQVRIVDQINRGRGAARAAGVAAATGTYIAFVDADIVLPGDWLSRCMERMDEYDACGGVAVPDGDVAYVYGLLGLQPKVAAHTVSVTGSNGLFKKQVFNVVSFDPSRRNGEDVAFNRDMDQAGIRTAAVPGLIVEHNESKTYAKSLAWLCESGIGASRQFYEQRKVRLPDLAFFGFVGLSILAITLPALTAFPVWLSLLCLVGYVSASSLLHLYGKFYLERTPLRSIIGIVVNDTLLISYYLGRIVGFATEWRR